MSTTAAIVGGATAGAISGSLAAGPDACPATIASFDNKTATVEHRSAFVECVRSQEPMPESAVLALKVMIVLSFVAAILGAVRGWNEGSYCRTTNVIWLAVTYVFGLWLAGFTVLIILTAVGFVLS
jgi:hypothetical protein